mgnify:CR=1 FL=1
MTTPTVCCDPRSLSFVTTAGLMSTHTTRTHEGSMLPTPMRCATMVLVRYAAAAIVNEWVPRLVDGSWAATICISEPDAGSDVGAGRTKAFDNGDGTWRIEGVKRFITGDAPAITIEHGVSERGNALGVATGRQRIQQVGHPFCAIGQHELLCLVGQRDVLLMSEGGIRRYEHDGAEHRDRQRECGRIDEGDTIGGASPELTHPGASGNQPRAASRSDRQRNQR